MVAILPLGLSIIGFQYLEELLLWINREAILGLLIFSSVSIFSMALALTPTTFVALVAGFLFPWAYFPSLLLTYPLAAILGRTIGLAWFKYWKQDLVGAAPRYQAFLDQLAERPFVILLMARLSPALPFAMTNLVLGQVKLSWRTYLLATMLGMLPRTLLSFWVGSQVNDIFSYLQSPEPLASERWIVLALLLISSLTLLLLMGRIWRRIQIGK
ncbi:MAG: TVP38/TMEM64 family protein [Bacteroidia bacterium]